MPSLLVLYARPLWPRLVLLLLLVTAGSGLELAGPHLVRSVIDGALSGAPVGGLLLTATLFLAVGLANVALSAGTTFLGADVGWRATNRLRADLLRNTLEQPLAFHDERTPGELIERIDSDPAALFRFLSGFLISVLGNALVLVDLSKGAYVTDADGQVRAVER